MVEIKVGGDKAIFEVEGWDKLWSLRSRLEIPLAHIKGVYADSKPAMGWLDGFKLVGTAIPHIFRAGIFYQEGDLVFWDVRNPENTIVIDLEHERVAKLILKLPSQMQQLVCSKMRSLKAALSNPWQSDCLEVHLNSSLR